MVLPTLRPFLSVLEQLISFMALSSPWLILLLGSELGGLLGGMVLSLAPTVPGSADFVAPRLT